MRTADIAKPRLRPRIRAANGRFRQRPKPVRRLWGRTPHCIFQPEAIAKGDTLALILCERILLLNFVTSTTFPQSLLYILNHPLSTPTLLYVLQRATYAMPASC